MQQDHDSYAREGLIGHVLDLQAAVISLQRRVFDLQQRVDELELELEAAEHGPVIHSGPSAPPEL